MGIYAIHIVSLETKVLQLKQSVFLSLPRGFTESIYALLNIQAKKILPNFYIYNPSTNYIIYLYIVSLVFYIFLVFLAYGTFRQKKVRIKLALPLIFVLSLSNFGLAMYFLMHKFTS